MASVLNLETHEGHREISQARGIDAFYRTTMPPDERNGKRSFMTFINCYLSAYGATPPEKVPINVRP